MIDLEADDIAVGVEIDDHAFDNLACLGARRVCQLDLQAVRLGITVQLHRSSLRKSAVEERVVTLSSHASAHSAREVARRCATDSAARPQPTRLS